MSLANLFDEAAQPIEQWNAPLFDAGKSIPTPKQVPVQQVDQDQWLRFDPLEWIWDFFWWVKDLTSDVWDFWAQAVHSLTDWGEGFLTNEISDRWIKNVNKYNKYQEDLKIVRDPVVQKQIYKQMEDEWVISKDYFNLDENTPKQEELSIDQKKAQEAVSTFKKSLEEQTKDLFDWADKWQQKQLQAGIDEYTSSYSEMYNNIQMSYNNSAFNKDEYLSKLNSDFANNLKTVYKEWAKNIYNWKDQWTAYDIAVNNLPDAVNNISNFWNQLMWDSNNASREHFLWWASWDWNLAFMNPKQAWNALNFLWTYVTSATSLMKEWIEKVAEKWWWAHDISDELAHLDVYKDSSWTFEKAMWKLWYWSKELIDWAPTLVPLIASVVVPEAWLAKIPAIANLKWRWKAINIAWDMAKDMLIYDQAAQMAMWRWNNEQDSLENLAFNLPINIGIWMLHVPVKDDWWKAMRNLFWVQAEMEPQWYISTDVLNAIKDNDHNTATVLYGSERINWVVWEHDITTLSPALQKQINDFQLKTADSFSRQVKWEWTLLEDTLWNHAATTSKQPNATPDIIKSQVKDLSDANTQIVKDSLNDTTTMVQYKKNGSTVSNALTSWVLNKEDIIDSVQSTFKNLTDTNKKKLTQEELSTLNTAKDFTLQYLTWDATKVLSIPKWENFIKYVDKINNDIIVNKLATKTDIPKWTVISEFIARDNWMFFDKINWKEISKAQMINKLSKRLQEKADDWLLSKIKSLSSDVKINSWELNNNTNLLDYLWVNELASKYDLSEITWLMWNNMHKINPLLLTRSVENLLWTWIKNLSWAQFSYIQALLLPATISKLEWPITSNAIKNSYIWKLWKKQEWGNYILDLAVMNTKRAEDKIMKALEILNPNEAADYLNDIKWVDHFADEIIKSDVNTVIKDTIKKGKAKNSNKVLQKIVSIDSNATIAEQAAWALQIEKMANDIKWLDAIAQKADPIILDELITETTTAIVNNTKKGKHWDAIKIKKNIWWFIYWLDKEADISVLKQTINWDENIDTQLKAIDSLLTFWYWINDTALIKTIQDKILSDTVLTASKEKVFNTIWAYVEELSNIWTWNIKLGTATKVMLDSKKTIDQMIIEFNTSINTIKNSTLNKNDMYSSILQVKNWYSQKLYSFILSDKRLPLDKINEFKKFLDASRDIRFVSAETKTLKDFMITAKAVEESLTTEELKNLRFPKFDNLHNKKMVVVNWKNVKYSELPSSVKWLRTLAFDWSTNTVPYQVMTKDIKTAQIIWEHPIVYITSNRTWDYIVWQWKWFVEIKTTNPKVEFSSLEKILSTSIDSKKIYFIGKEHFNSMVSQINWVVNITTAAEPEKILTNFLNNKNIYVSDFDIYPMNSKTFYVNPKDEQKLVELFKNNLFDETFSSEFNLTKKDIDSFVTQQKSYFETNPKTGKKRQKFYQEKWFSEFSNTGADYGKNASYLMSTLEWNTNFKMMNNQIKSFMDKAWFTWKELIPLDKVLDIIWINTWGLWEIYRKAIRTIFDTSDLKSTYLKINDILSHEDIWENYIQYIKELKWDSSIMIWDKWDTAISIFNDIFKAEWDFKWDYWHAMETVYKQMIQTDMPIDQIREAMIWIFNDNNFTFKDAMNFINPKITWNIFPWLDAFRLQSISDKILSTINPKQIINVRNSLNEEIVKQFKRYSELNPNKDIFVIKFLEDLQRKWILNSAVNIYTWIDTLGTLKDSMADNLKKITTWDYMRILLEQPDETSMSIMDWIKSNIKYVVDDLNSKFSPEEVIIWRNDLATIADDTWYIVWPKWTFKKTEKDITSIWETVSLEKSLTWEEWEEVSTWISYHWVEVDFDNIILWFIWSMKKYSSDFESLLKIKWEYPAIAKANSIIFSDPVNYKLIWATLDTTKLENLKSLLENFKSDKQKPILYWDSDMLWSLWKDYSVDKAYDIFDMLNVADAWKTFWEWTKWAEEFMKKYKPTFSFLWKEPIKFWDNKAVHNIINNMYDSVLSYLDNIKKTQWKSKADTLLYTMRLDWFNIAKDFHVSTIDTNPLWKAYTAELWDAHFYRKIEILNDRYLQQLRKNAEIFSTGKPWIYSVLADKTRKIIDAFWEVYHLKDEWLYTWIEETYKSKAWNIRNELLKNHWIYDELWNRVEVRWIDLVFPEWIREWWLKIRTEDIKDVIITKYSPTFYKEWELPKVYPLMDAENVVETLDNIWEYGWREELPWLTAIWEWRGMPDIPMELRIKYFDRETGKERWLVPDSEKGIITIEDSIQPSTKDTHIIPDNDPMLQPQTIKEMNEGISGSPCQL